MPDETEKDEKERLTREGKKAIEDMARSATLNLGDVYLKNNGNEKVVNDELQIKSFIIAWSNVMGVQLPFNVSTVEIMMAILSKLPIDCGMDIMQRPSFIQLQSMLSAVRNKMIGDRQARIKASSPELFTASTDGK